MVRLKEDIAWEVLDNYGDFRERSIFSGIDEVPDDLRWWSYWKNVPTQGMIEFIEVNMGTREIRCQGCLEEFAEMVATGIVEVEKNPDIKTKSGEFCIE